MVSILQPARQTSWLTANRVFIGRSMRLSFRDIESLLIAIVLPVMLMFLFTYVFGGAIDTTGNYVNYVVPGIILLCAGFGSSGVAVVIAQDMMNGIIDRFRTMPIHSTGVIVGHIIASLFRNLFTTGVVFGVALLVGFEPSANVLEWAAAIGIISLFILAFTCLYAAIGLVAGSPSAANGYGFVLLFLPYVSSAFVSTDTMPSWLQWAADHQPVTPVIESVRGLLTGTSMGDHIWWAIGWSLLIMLVSLMWSVRLFRKRAGRR